MEEPQRKPLRKPLKYKTAEELQKAVDEYFDYCDNKTKEMHSEKLGDMIVPDPEPYTMAGLAYHIGLTRMGLLKYSRRERFSEVIERAKSRVEADIERRMSSKDTFTPGQIFNLKNNFGWKDRHDVDTNLKGEVVASFDDEQINRIAERVASRRRGVGDPPGEEKPN